MGLDLETNDTDRPAPPTLSPARQQLVDLATSVAGLSAAPASLERYLDLLACSPNETPAMRAAMAKMSSCALTVRGLWFRAGLRDPVLVAPYVIEHAVSDVVDIAGRAGALKSRSTPPRPGYVVIVDGPVHVLTVIGVDGATITSVDGGQLFEGFEAILRRTRTLAGTTLGGRTILHVIDGDAIAAAESSAFFSPAELGAG